MSAHRYWRLNINSNNGGGGNGTSIATLQMRTALGGSSVTTGGTASASSTWSGSASDAFDGNVSTVWAGVSHSSDWLKYDFGAGNEKDILEIAITADGTGGATAPKDADFQYSDDNATWTTKFSFLGQTGWAANETRVFDYKPATPNHRYWRLYIAGNNGGGSVGTNIATLQMREVPGGPSVCSGGVASASSTWSGSAADAFDGNTSTVWAGASHNSDTLEYAFASGTTKSIMEIAITADASGGSGAPNAGYVQYSDDNSVWGTAFGFSGQTGWGANETRVFTAPYYTAPRRRIHQCINS